MSSTTDQFFSSAIESTAKSRELKTELTKLLWRYDRLTLLTCFAEYALFGDPRLNNEPETGPRVVAYENTCYLAFRLGEVCLSRRPNVDVVFKLFRIAEQLAHLELNRIYDLNDLPNIDPLRQVITSVRSHLYGIRGSAFPDQLHEMICESYRPANRKLKDEFDIEVEEICLTIQDFFNVVNYKPNLAISRDNPTKPLHAGSPSACRNVYTISVGDFTSCPDVANFNEKAWNFLRSELGLTQERARQLPFSEAIARHPLPVIGSTVLPIYLTSLFDALDLWLQNYVYNDRRLVEDCNSAKRNYSEGKVTAALKLALPDAKIIRSASYPDPDKPDGKSTTECDVLAWYDPFLVVAEVKSGKYRLSGRSCDNGHLYHDLKKLCGDSVEQGLRVLRALDRFGTVTFVSKETGETATVDTNKVYKSMILGCTQYFVGPPAFEIESLQKLNIVRAGVFPWLVSVHDLEKICLHTTFPEILLHYADRRCALLKSGIWLVCDELDLFENYLINRLIFDTKETQNPSGIWFSGSGVFELYDRWEKGVVSQKPDIGPKILPVVFSLMIWMAGSGRREAAIGIYSLLNLSNREWQQLDLVISNFYAQGPSRTGVRRAIVLGQLTVVALFAVNNETVDGHESICGLYATMLAYRTGKPALAISFDYQPDLGPHSFSIEDNGDDRRVIPELDKLCQEHRIDEIVERCSLR